MGAFETADVALTRSRCRRFPRRSAAGALVDLAKPTAVGGERSKVAVRGRPARILELRPPDWVVGVPRSLCAGCGAWILEASPPDRVVSVPRSLCAGCAAWMLEMGPPDWGGGVPR